MAMDTEQIVERILREIRAVRSTGEGMPAAAVPETAAAPSFAAESAVTQPFCGKGVFDIAPDSKPCSDSVRSDKLRACDESRSLLLRHMQDTTSARIGIGKCGARLRTATMLQFRADHAAAKDAVLLDVPDTLLSQLGLFSVKTLCSDHEEYLERPDLGAQFSPETRKRISEECSHNMDVQIYAAGGLSSTAITANLANILPALTDGLRARNLTVGTPFFVRFARVSSMDEISELLLPKVICVLIGERPGLATAESMSAYLAYHATKGMPNSKRTVVSNIHRGGVPAVEAGAYIAELIEKMIQKQASGVDFAK